MKKRFQNCKAGSTLVEVVVAITILGLVCAPICSSLVLAARVNARSEQVMAAQLSVSSAVERLMAEGVTAVETKDSKKYVTQPKFDNITVEVADDDDTHSTEYYEIKVYDGTVEADAIVVVKTAVKANPGGDG